MNMHTTPTAATVEIGTAVLSPNGTGYVSAILPAPRGEFLIGATMAPVLAQFEIVFGDHISTLSDGIVAPWFDRARRAEIAPLTAEEVQARRAQAVAATDTRRQAAQADKEAQQTRAAAFRLEAAEKMPIGAKAVIVAELHEDDSDSMSDYWGHKVRRVVILAWSAHTRDLFPELRKACAHFPETADLATAPEKAEHREKYSMGAGFYLKNGNRDSTGWSVKKVRLYDGGPAGVPVGEWALEATPAPADHPAAAPATSGAFVIEHHKHSTKGFDMWIATMAERVERDEYDRLLTQAKAFGGWYSRAWNGAPAGFAFKKEAAALAFAGVGEPAAPKDAPTPRPAPTPKASPAAKLRQMAELMHGEINGKFADRLANTPKRQREAQSARLDGMRLQRTQQAMRALADLHDAGQVPAILQGLTTKAAIFDLARAEIVNTGGYYDAGRETGAPANSTPQALALWALLKGPTEAERAALALREKVEALQFANIPGFFPTPAAVVLQMIEEAELPARGSILEPEAGSGAILDMAREHAPGCELIAFERHNTLRQILELKGYTLTGADFLESEPGFTVDRVLMNPPFENGQDMAHVMRAFEHLKEGGRLVAIMSPGPFFRQDAKALAFRRWFDGMDGRKVDLPANSFKESGTGVATVLVVIDR